MKRYFGIKFCYIISRSWLTDTLDNMCAVKVG